MEKILLIITLVTLAVYTLKKLQLELHMMQLNSYMNPRYYKWLRKNFLTTHRLFEFVSVTISFILIAINQQLAGFTLSTVSLLLLSIALFKRKQKKALVYTSRVKRLMFAFLLVVVLPLVFIGPISDFSLLFWALAFMAPVLSFFYIGRVNILISPVEIAINKWYYNDAKKKLKQMPDLKIIGITGSYGKTSTKHFLHRILSEKYNTLMTPGSYNTTMGVIRTIREQLKPTHQVFIVEMGAKQIGDIKEICELVNPEIGILTAVGEQHLDTFKNIENVQKTKFELIDALPGNGLAVLNADYDKVLNREVKNCNTQYYSAKVANTDYFLSEINYNKFGSKFEINSKDGETKGSFETKLMGSYNLSNILASYIVAEHLGIDNSRISYAVKKIAQVEHRLEVKRNTAGITVIDDAFNSNPYGAEMALEVLKNIDGNAKIIVTPGMIELGDKQEFYNKQFGNRMASSCTYAILVGNTNSQSIKAGLVEANFSENSIFMASNFNEAVQHLNTIVKLGDVVLYENDLPDTYEQLK